MRANGTEQTLACILLLFQGQCLKTNYFIWLPLMDNKRALCRLLVWVMFVFCSFVCLLFCLFFLPWASFQFTYCVSEHFNHDELVSCVLSLSSGCVLSIWAIPGTSPGCFVMTKCVRQHEIVKGDKLKKSESSLINVVIAEGSTNTLKVSTSILAHCSLPVNKKAPIHFIISINDKVYRPL